MKIIRKDVFETNSSSTHSLTIVDSDKYRDWVSGKCFYYKEDDEFVYMSLEERNELVKNIMGYEGDIKAFILDHSWECPLSQKEWEDSLDYYESFCYKYKDVIAFGYYGCDY